MKRIALLIAALSVSTSALAELGAGVRVGTTGVGVDLAYKITDSLSARVGYSYANFGVDVTATDVDYDSKIKLSNFSLLADWNLLAGFRITAGLVPQKNKIDVTATPSSGSFTINGDKYAASDVGNFGGKIESGNSVAPYLGVGYGIVAGRGVNFYADLGVQYQGSPKAALSVACGPALNAIQCAQLKSDVSAEQTKLEDKIKGFKWYPVVSLGVTIGF